MSAATPLDAFHPLIARWFRAALGPPTEAQALAWPKIAAGEATLIAAPTGSGKTLAAFLVCIDRLLREGLAGKLPDGVDVVYVSPLKALSNDIHRNLDVPLLGIGALAAEAGVEMPVIRTMVRTGDTPMAERAKMLRRPPQILVTTPESLFILITSGKARELFRGVRTVIVDEIHALARDKRGSHLSLTLERLDALCERPPVRVGLSATQRPIDEIARFLVGVDSASATNELPDAPAAARPCEIIDAGHLRELDLDIDVPPSPLEAVCSNEQWAEVYERLTQYIDAHRSTLVFVNTRRLAERVAHHLTERLGEDAVASHHGSLSRQVRHLAEQRLKTGQLKVIVATASLELGIDVGYIDLVCQIGSPRSIATFLQRIGRAGHSLGAIPKGRLFPLTRDELVECLALVRCVRRRELDQIIMPVAPLDILAQQIIAATACEDWQEDDLFRLCRRAWPYRDLPREKFDEIVRMTSEGASPRLRRGAYIHRDAIAKRLRGRRGARLAAITSGGAIPEAAQFRVVAEPDGTVVGMLEEDFALESLAGDVFLLGNTSWRIRNVRGGEVHVQDAKGQPPSIPFWFGEAPGRTIELSEAISQLRSDVAERIGEPANNDAVANWLADECGSTAAVTHQAVEYIAAQQAALGVVPTGKQIVFERFFDESGGMQVVIHAPLGARINRAWGLALRKRFCRSFDFELQASADDDGVVLSVGPQHSFPLDSLCKMLSPQNAPYLLEQALLAAPMFQTRWRWNVSRALAVLRFDHGKKVPPYLQRFRADDLLAAVFPAQAGCLENHHGDMEIPDHPLVKQTVYDCLHEAMDMDGWVSVLAAAQEGRIEFIARDTREPSPFCHELLNANPYAFLDGAAAEERRTRAVFTRRSLSVEALRDLGRLDPAAIEQVRAEAWPTVRDADELHDALLSLVVLLPEEATPWAAWLSELAEAGRAAKVTVAGLPEFWFAAERWPVVRAALSPLTTGHSPLSPAIFLPAELEREWSTADALVELVRGRIQFAGPITAQALGAQLHIDADRVFAALEAVEATGVVLRGHFTAPLSEKGANGNGHASPVEWCDRRLFARIHRLTLDGLRRQIEPATVDDYLRFLVRWQHLLPDDWLPGSGGVREAVGQLQGFNAPAGSWESHLLAARVDEYDAQWLDQQFLSGQLVWGRLRPPRREPDSPVAMAAMTRAVPITLMHRGDVAWLLPWSRNGDVAAPPGNAPGDGRTVAATDDLPLRSSAGAVLDSLTARGALFPQELLVLTGLLPAQLDDALRELAAHGLVTSDGFASVRTIVREKHTSQRRVRRPLATSGNAPVGRWSLFPGIVATPTREEHVGQWCRQLLRRYGVVFRDMLAREAAAPAWGELVQTYRQLERRGEIRGGRFVTGVGGEQYATEEAVQRLRQVRDAAADEPWIVVSAADPLNLVGILSTGSRLSAGSRGAAAIRGGRFVAVRQGKDIQFLGTLAREEQADIGRALLRGRRVWQESKVSAIWSH